MAESMSLAKNAIHVVAHTSKPYTDVLDVLKCNAANAASVSGTVDVCPALSLGLLPGYRLTLSGVPVVPPS